MFIDVVGSALVISDSLFKTAQGEWKVLKRDRSAYAKLSAMAIKSPDEIWVRIEPLVKERGRYRIVRRYIKAFYLRDRFYGLAVFELGGGEWTGVTAFAPEPLDERRRENYINNQRAGTLIYRRK